MMSFSWPKILIKYELIITRTMIISAVYAKSYRIIIKKF